MATIPSIALIPSGVKAGKLYSVLPTNGTGDFTTTRASVATRVNENGLIEEVAANVPRLDYSDGTCPSLLLEGTATNLINYSEDFSVASWNTASTRSMTVSPSTVLDLRGGTDAFRITSTASNNQLAAFGSVTSGLNYANSIYVRRVSGVGTINLRDVNNNSNIITLSESDGWKRIESSVLSNSTNGRFYLNLSTVGDVIDVWGAQLEENSYATSYIKTIGTVQTRVADTATGSGNSTVINSSEGVLYFEGKSLNNTVALNRKISLGDGSFNNGVEFGYQNTTNKMQFIIRSGGVISMNIETTIFDVTEFNKIAISYKSNEGKVFVNGSQIGVTDTTVVIPIGLSQLDFNLSTSFDFEGKTKDLRVYTTALSDAELTTLTTI